MAGIRIPSSGQFRLIGKATGNRPGDGREEKLASLVYGNPRRCILPDNSNYGCQKIKEVISNGEIFKCERTGS